MKTIIVTTVTKVTIKADDTIEKNPFRHPILSRRRGVWEETVTLEVFDYDLSEADE